MSDTNIVIYSLNAEITVDCYVSAFNFFVLNNGTVNFKIHEFNMSSVLTTLGDYYLQTNTLPPLLSSNELGNFDIYAGNASHALSPPKFMKRGTLIQIYLYYGAQLGIQTNGVNYNYPDINQGDLTRMGGAGEKWRLNFNVITSSPSVATTWIETINGSIGYANAGTYNIISTLVCDNLTLSTTTPVTVIDSK